MSGPFHKYPSTPCLNLKYKVLSLCCLHWRRRKTGSNNPPQISGESQKKKKNRWLVVSSQSEQPLSCSQKTKPTDGEDDDDPEKDKLRSGLNSAIVREKPNVKRNDVAGLRVLSRLCKKLLFCL